MHTRLVDEPDRLAAACERFGGAGVLALDTEFVRERTYFPRLCLVQLAAGEEAACLDPLALEDALDPFERLLADPGIVKVFHAARQDLEVLLPVLGQVPEPLFDTQVAAALCGHPAQVSYAGLVEDLLGVSLEKGHARTDWCRRPLSAEQMRYAVDDVRYLCALHERLSSRLEDTGRSAWMEEEMSALARVASAGVADEDVYARVRGARSLDAAGQHRLQRLAAWREREARRRNLPREWVVPDAALVAVAAASGLDRESLSAMPELGPKRARRHGEALLRLAGSAPPSPAQPLLDSVRPLDAAERAACSRLMDAVRRRAGELGIAAPLLATRRDVEALVRGRRDGSVLAGWRREAVGEHLLAALEAGA